MLAAIAYRSLAQAKAAHADIKVLAAGDSDAQKKAIQMLKVLKTLLSLGNQNFPLPVLLKSKMKEIQNLPSRWRKTKTFLHYTNYPPFHKNHKKEIKKWKTKYWGK